MPCDVAAGRTRCELEIQFESRLRYFFLNFEMKDSEGNFRTDVVLSDRDTHVPFSDKLRFVFLQLPCFKKEESECENDFERWIYVLKNMETLQRLPFKARKSVFEKLEQIVDIASLSKEERMKYDESIKVYRDQLATLDFAKQKGRAEERKSSDNRWEKLMGLLLEEKRYDEAKKAASSKEFRETLFKKYGLE